jgi:hypothetical protein
MVVIKIFTDCITKPIRFACIFGDSFSDTRGVVVSDNDPIPDVPTYLFHVGCGKANMDGITHFIGSHYGLDRESRSKPLAQDGNPLCIHGKSCPLGGLTIQELFIPLVIDELASHYSSLPPHGNNQ